MREHRAGPVSRAAVALASAFSVLGDCLRVDQKTRRPTARPVPRFGPHLGPRHPRDGGAKASKNWLPQAPRIAAAAARTRPELSQASIDRATRTLAMGRFVRADLFCMPSRSHADDACCPQRHAHGYAQMPHAFGPCAVREGCPSSNHTAPRTVLNASYWQYTSSWQAMRRSRSRQL